MECAVSRMVFLLDSPSSPEPFYNTAGMLMGVVWINQWFELNVRKIDFITLMCDWWYSSTFNSRLLAYQNYYPCEACVRVMRLCPSVYVCMCVYNFICVLSKKTRLFTSYCSKLSTKKLSAVSSLNL